MFGVDAKAARATWTIFLIVLSLYVVYLVRDSLLIFIAAFIFAYALRPLVDLICRYSPPRFPPVAALAIVYVLLLASVALFIVAAGGQIVDQARSLADRLPGLVEKHRDLSTIPLPSWAEPARVRLAETLRQQIETGADRILPLLQRAVGGVLGFVGSLGFLILVPILTFLFLLDGKQIRATVLDWVPRHRRPLVKDIMADLNTMLTQYIRALVILSALTSVMYLIFFSIIGLPYAVLLATVAAPLEFIPVIGPLAGSLLILAVAVFTGYPHIWWILIFFAAYRLFQDYFLTPYLMSSGIEIHPLLTIFGAIAGNQVGGLWGMFLAVPLMASLRVIFKHIRRASEEHEAMPERALESPVSS